MDMDFDREMFKLHTKVNKGEIILGWCVRQIDYTFPTPSQPVNADKTRDTFSTISTFSVKFDRPYVH